MATIRHTIFGLVASAAHVASAQPVAFESRGFEEVSSSGSCLSAAALHYGLAPEVLEAIAMTESGMNPLALSLENQDGSSDIGLMQINSRWLPELSRWGMAPESLYDGCTSAWVGAWILAGNVARYGYSWQAVGAYNAGTADTPAAQSRRDAYARRVARQLTVDAPAGVLGE